TSGRIRGSEWLGRSAHDEGLPFPEPWAGPSFARRYRRGGACCGTPRTTPAALSPPWGGRPRDSAARLVRWGGSRPPPRRRRAPGLALLPHLRSGNGRARESPRLGVLPLQLSGQFDGALGQLAGPAQLAVRRGHGAIHTEHIEFGLRLASRPFDLLLDRCLIAFRQSNQIKSIVNS